MGLMGFFFTAIRQRAKAGRRGEKSRHQPRKRGHTSVIKTSEHRKAKDSTMCVNVALVFCRHLIKKRYCEGFRIFIFLRSFGHLFPLFLLL